MRINTEAIEILRRAHEFVMQIERIFAGCSDPSALARRLARQNAIIFCLKGLGICIDKVAETMRLDLSKRLTPEQTLAHDTLLFWQNMHYLRNALIHHFDSNMLGDFRLSEGENEMLFKLCRLVGQVKFYLELIISQGKTDVDLHGQRFKVFFAFHDLAELLRKHSPRESRGGITQVQYLQAMVDALCIIENHIVRGRELNVTFIESLRTEESAGYYTIQNLLDCVAILGNPNPFGDGTQLIKDITRRVIFSIESQIDTWLRRLGSNRILAAHTEATGIIPNERLVVNLQEMRLLHRALLSPAMQRTDIGAQLRDRFPKISAHPPSAPHAGVEGKSAGKSEEERGSQPSDM